MSGLSQVVAMSPLCLVSDREWTLACACGPLPDAGRSFPAVQVEDAVFRWSTLGRASRNNPAAPQHVGHPHHRPNAWGLRGMQGNVRELAWHHLQRARTVAMGGGFRSGPQELRPDHSIACAGPADDVGFRLVRELQPGEAAILDKEFQA
jgi:formylglycine-generating enzyme required for sulfatase activity